MVGRLGLALGLGLGLGILNSRRKYILIRLRHIHLKWLYIKTKTKANVNTYFNKWSTIRKYLQLQKKTIKTREQQIAVSGNQLTVYSVQASNL